MKILLAENRDYLRFMEESLKMLRFYLAENNNDVKIYNALKKIIDKSTDFSIGLKESLIELEVLDLSISENKDEAILNKSKFEIDVRFSFNRYKRENKIFVVGLIYIESMNNILLNYGYSTYVKAFHKAMNAIINGVGKDDVVAIIDNNTFGILYEGDNPLKLKKLKGRISNVELRADKTFEALKVRACGTVPRSNDKDAEDLLSRLYGLFYEIYSFRNRNFVFE
jgi:GGDEF domain-containing protein